MMTPECLAEIEKLASVDPAGGMRFPSMEAASVWAAVPDLCAALREAWRERDEAGACCRWEADTQARHLEAVGLTGEFPHGCDAIQYVAEALVAARRDREAAREVLAFIEARAARAFGPDGKCYCITQESLQVSAVIHISHAMEATTAMARQALGRNACAQEDPC